MVNYFKFLFLLMVLATGALAAHKLETGQRLKAGEKLTSRNGLYSLHLNTEGNLVLTEKDGSVRWESKTKDPRAEYVGLDKNGNLSIRRKGGKKIWETGTVGGKGTYLIVQNDGNVVIYVEVPASAIWSSNTGE